MYVESPRLAGSLKGVSLSGVFSLALAILVGCGGSGGDSSVQTQPAQAQTVVVGPTGGMASIGPEGGTIKNQMGQTLVEIPPGAHDGAATVRVGLAPGTITVTRSGVINLLKNDAPMVVTLPPFAPGTSFIPEACPAQRVDPSTAMPECWSDDATLLPGYFGVAAKETPNSGDFSYRLGKNRLVTSQLSATLSLERGSQLTSFKRQSANLQGRVPVLFIHGFQEGTTFGGGDSTWASLPDRVRSLNVPGAVTFVPFEFRWRTNASYITVANDLANAIALIKTATGSNVHVVAHSFGGVLARSALQDVSGQASAGAVGAARANVKSLTTVGTPHSGILTLAANVAGKKGPVPLPRGWEPFGPNAITCFQISCFQSGRLFSMLPDFALEDLKEGPNLDVPSLGYVSARLREGIDAVPDRTMVDLPILTLIGESFGGCDPTVPSVCIPLLRDGDGLIAYEGQRFRYDPTAQGKSLLLETRTKIGLLVSERILGLPPGADSLGTDPIAALAALSPYVASLKSGYWHNIYLKNAAAAELGEGMEEVAVPSGSRFSCTSPCEHDTWANLREFLLSLHGGPPSANFPTTTSPQVAAVSSVGFAPKPAVAGSPVVISIVGTNLSADITVSLSGCTGLAVVSGATTGLRQFTCVPTQPGVDLTGSVTNGFGSVLGTFILPVATGGAVNQPPQAMFSVSPQTPTAGQVVILDPAGSGDPDGTIVRWTWNFGDGPTYTSTAPQPLPVSHVYSGLGTYSVSLDVTDNAGATTRATRSVSVAPVSTNVGTQLAMTAAPDPVRPGELVQYAMTVVNRAVNGSSYTVDAQVPNHATVPVGSIGQGGFCVGFASNAVCPTGGTMRWTNFSLISGQSAALQFAALVDTTSPPANGTLIRSTATATSNLSGGASAAVDVMIGQ